MMIQLLEKTLESLRIRAMSTNRNTEQIQHSTRLIEGYLSDYMKWGGAYGREETKNTS